MPLLSLFRTAPSKLKISRNCESSAILGWILLHLYDGEKEEEKCSEVKLHAYALLFPPSGPEEEGACVAVGSTEVHVWSFATRLFNAITYAHTHIYLSMHAYHIYVFVCIYILYMCV